MKQWIPVTERMPPDEWCGLVIADMRPDRPVFAHTANAWFRNEFPYADYFAGKWKDALLISDSYRNEAKIIYWLEVSNDNELYPSIPNIQ